MIQCYHCQGYNHIANACTRPAICGWCAGGHDTKECPKTGQKKCVNCRNTGHEAWAASCPKRQEEKNKAKQAYLRRPQLYSTFDYMTSPKQTPGTHTPREYSEQPGQNQSGPASSVTSSAKCKQTTGATYTITGQAKGRKPGRPSRWEQENLDPMQRRLSTQVEGTRGSTNIQLSMSTQEEATQATSTDDQYDEL